MEATVEFKLPARLRKKGQWFISSCPPLDVFSQGHSREEAEHNLIDALTGFFSSRYERGTLETVLRDAGFVLTAPRQRAGRRDDLDSTVSVRLPFSISTRIRRASYSGITTGRGTPRFSPIQ